MHKPASNQKYAFSPLRTCLIIFLYFFSTTSSLAESIVPTTTNAQASQNFIVSTKGGLVSVTATEAPLKDVIERIGQALDIEVEAQVGDNEKVTAEFQDLTLDQAMERLSENHAYTADGDGGKLVKLFVFPKGYSAQASHDAVETSENEVERPASSAEPFKFEFNPAEFVQQAQ